MSQTELFLLWGYVVAMALGVVLFFVWSRDPKGVPQYEYLIAMAIPLWSGIMYTLIATGFDLRFIDGQTTVTPRYYDWLITTPLLLTALALTGMIHVRKNVGLIAGLVVADVVMIVSGLVADLSIGTARYTWYGVGVVAFLVVLWLVWGPVRNVAQAHPEPRIGDIYTRVAAFLTVLWVLYPLGWILGPSGFGVFNQTIDTAVFTIVPILSKVGFSIYDLGLLRNLNLRKEDVPSTAGARTAVA